MLENNCFLQDCGLFGSLENNKLPDKAGVVDVIKTWLAFWIKAKFNITDYSVDDFRRGIEGVRRIKI